jgi:hypothetical protein
MFRAVQFLREAPEPGWDVIAGRIISAVRSTARPGGQPVAAQTPPDRPGAGRIYVSDHVLRSTLAIVLRQRYVVAPTGISFEVDDSSDTLRAVHLELTGSYGTPLGELASQIRTTTREVIAELLGDTPTGHGPINITITDVVTGDPLTA